MRKGRALRSILVAALFFIALVPAARADTETTVLIFHNGEWSLSPGGSLGFQPDSSNPDFANIASNLSAGSQPYLQVTLELPPTVDNKPYVLKWDWNVQGNSNDYFGFYPGSNTISAANTQSRSVVSESYTVFGSGTGGIFRFKWMVTKPSSGFLSASFENLRVVAPPIAVPQLYIALRNLNPAQVQVSWATTFFKTYLQSTTDLFGGKWIDEARQPSSSNPSNVVIFPAPGNRYFRLRTRWGT